MATPSDKSFAEKLSKATGLKPDVIRAWARAEGAYAPNGTGGYNFLNLRAKGGGSSYSGVQLAGVSSNGFAQFRNEDDAVAETAHWINTMPNYAGIRASTKVGSKTQIAAIAASPWDAGHYDGGRKLLDAFKAVTGLPFGPQDPGAFGIPGTDSVGRWIDDKLGGIPSPGDVAKGVGGALVPDAVEGAAATAVDIGREIFDPQNWLRVGFIVGGGVLVLGGVVLLARAVGAPVPVGGPAGMAAQLATRTGGKMEAAAREANGGRLPTAREGVKRKTTKVYLPGDEPRRRSSSGSGPSDDVPF